MELASRQQTASQWVHEYSDSLYAFALSRVKNADAAKDIVQETFLAAWRNAENYNSEASVKTWLFSILKNKLIDYYRRSASKFTEEISSITNEEDRFFDSADHWAAGSYPKAWVVEQATTIETKEFYGVLNKCRSKLKDIQNLVFGMKYIDGLDSDEICRVLELSSSNYWVLVHRAKVQLRNCLEKNWFLR